MILSIDRVLRMLAEGKSIEEIASLANVDVDDVKAVIEEARQILLKTHKQRTKSKVIIKKKIEKTNNEKMQDDDLINDILSNGCEFLTKIPAESTLIMYADGASKGNPGPAGIGIVVYDAFDNVLAKISKSIGIKTNNQAEYIAIITALKLAIYFDTKNLKIRTDSELVVRQINGEYRVNNENMKPLYEQVMELKNKIQHVKIEHVYRTVNQKADDLAKRASIALSKSISKKKMPKKKVKK